MAKNDAVFTKEQLMKSDTFSEHRDVLAVVLREDKTYTKEQVRKAIEKFFKK
jgi:hypothetical protein